jgi:hypothetical protein
VEACEVQLKCSLFEPGAKEENKEARTVKA